MKIDRCDDCRKNDAALVQIFIATCNQQCPASGKSEVGGDHVDLCSVCACKWFLKLIEARNRNFSSPRIEVREAGYSDVMKEIAAL